MKQSKFEETYSRIDEKNLGQGAQGAVFRVIRKGDPEGIIYAAKTYHCGSQQSNQISKFFQREVNAYKMIPEESAFIGKLVDSFDDGSTKVLVLELIDGKSFQDSLWMQTKQDKIVTAKTGSIQKTKVMFTKQQVLKWTIQIANIVQTLQKNNVLYGDLHFRNLMITSSDDLVLTDFGFSFIVDKSAGKVNDKTCQYKWMKDKLIAIEKNNHTPQERIKKMFNHHIQYFSVNLHAFLDHCQAPKEELVDLIELQKLMSGKALLQDNRKSSQPVFQERPSIQEIITTLHKIAIQNNYDFDESLFIIEEDEVIEESHSDEQELTEEEKRSQMAEEYCKQMFGHLF